MHEIYCSTGALIDRPNGRDYRLLKTFVPQLECDGIEPGKNTVFIPDGRA